MENSREVPQKFKTELSYDSIIPFLGDYPKRMKTFFIKDHLTSVHYNIIYNSPEAI